MTESAFRTLIAADELAALYRRGENIVVFDCRFSLSDPTSGRSSYDGSHLPEARYADLEKNLSSPVVPGKTGRHPLPDPERFGAWLGACGVGNETQIVAYDAADGSIAARLWWLAGWVGHERAAVLDGGFAEWQRRGLPLTAAPPAVRPTSFRIRLDPARIVDADEVERARRSDARRLFDARAGARYRGEVEPIDPVAGHIEGARSLPFEENLEDGRFRSTGELRARYERALGGVPPHAAIAYCGSGVTACHTILAAAHAGLEGMRLYPGSFSEWICQPGRAVGRG